MFYTTLFFPWTIDVYGGYFEPPNTIRTEQFFVQLLIPVVLPVAMPLSIISALAGGLVTQSLMKTRNFTSSSILRNEHRPIKKLEHNTRPILLGFIFVPI